MNLKMILCVDLECTCWEGMASYEDKKKREIIEIGVTSITYDGERNPVLEKGKRLFVKNVKTDISQYCTNLTGITQEIIDKDGVSLEEACKYLQDTYNSINHPWFSWGRFDRDCLIGNCRNQNVVYPMSSEYFNLSVLYSVMTRRKNKQSMKKALASLEMGLIGTHHNGTDDSFNVARILSKLFW